MSAVMKKELAKVKKIIHPHSRKSAAIVKKSTRICNRNQAKQVSSLKQVLIREKLLWLQENMAKDVCPYTPELTMELLEKYISRHDEELNFIAEKNNVPGKRNKSYASREDILRMTKEREMQEYETSGIEIPNIMISAQCSMLQKWNGNLRFLPNFFFRRWGKKSLQLVIRKNKAHKITLPNKPIKQECTSSTTMDVES